MFEELAQTPIYRSPRPPVFFPPGSAYTLLSAVPASPSAAAASDIVCYVDPALGVVNNVRQANAAACTVGGVEVTIPTAGKFLTKVEMAVDKELPFIGRLIFHVRDSLDGKPSVHTCGWTGGDAVSLFPAGNVAASIDGEFRGWCLVAARRVVRRSSTDARNVPTSSRPLTPPCLLQWAACRSRPPPWDAAAVFCSRRPHTPPTPGW